MNHVSVQVFPCGPFSTNALVVSSGTACFVVDPSPGSAPEIIQYVIDQGLSVEKIILTHSHWDHIADCYELKEHYKVPVWVHRLDAPNLQDPGCDGVEYPALGRVIRGVTPDGFLEEGQKVGLGEANFVVMHTPGHSRGLVSLYSEQESLLICGDLFFRRSIGTVSLPTSEPDKMWSSLERICKLPKETRVYPGHGETTTIGKETWLPRAKEIFSYSSN